MNSGEHKDVLAELEGEVGDAVRQICAIEPLQAQQVTLAKLQQLVAANSKVGKSCVVANPGKRASGWNIAWISAIAAAAVIAIATFAVFSRPAISFASQVALAMAGQDWIYVVESDGDGDHLCETWYSLSKNISAQKIDGSIEFRDHRVGEFFRYSTADKKLYRASEEIEPRRYDHFAKLVTDLLESGRTPEESIGKFLTEESNQVEIVRQDVSSSGEDLEYAVKLLVRGRRFEVLFRVDSETKLPRSCVISGSDDDGKPVSRNMRFKYPETGPADIYALNVPKNATLVDRIATDKERMLIDAVRAQERFDNYRAISVRYDPDDPVWWVNASVEVLHRKGKRWRRSYCFVSFYGLADDGETPIRHEGPGDDDDMALWWAEQIKRTAREEEGVMEDGQVMAVRIGTWEWHVTDGRFTKSRFESDVPGFWSLLPDYKARPPMGGSGVRFEGRVIENPDGPSGTILFELEPNENPSGAQESANEKADRIDAHRSWVDPERGHLVVRSELGANHTTVVEAAAQSPGGHWYPTRTLQTSLMSDGKVIKQVTEFYLDFEAEIPDELFRIKEE